MTDKFENYILLLNINLSYRNLLQENLVNYEI